MVIGQGGFRRQRWDPSKPRKASVWANEPLLTSSRRHNGRRGFLLPAIGPWPVRGALLHPWLTPWPAAPRAMGRRDCHQCRALKWRGGERASPPSPAALASTARVKADAGETGGRGPHEAVLGAQHACPPVTPPPSPLPLVPERGCAARHVACGGGGGGIHGVADRGPLALTTVRQCLSATRHVPEWGALRGTTWGGAVLTRHRHDPAALCPRQWVPHPSPPKQKPFLGRRGGAGSVSH